jgi:(2S)-methylsuccinyl-CoA dehydrogenase
MDEQQVVCYEIAWAGAELLAADAYLRHTDPSNALDRALASLFVTDVMTAILSRLESIYVEDNLDLSPLHGLASQAEWLVMRRNCTSSQALSDVGRAVLDAHGDVDAVALEGDTAMAQAAFKRFASEVVAPLAEQIHRQNLTVPEAILQPLREMGVFGLSIPEAYGGSAPSGSENALMMIAVTEALSEASLAAAGSLITRPEILARALLAGGTQQQKGHCPSWLRASLCVPLPSRSRILGRMWLA